MGFKRGGGEGVKLGELARGIRFETGNLNSIQSGLAAFSRGIAVYSSAHKSLYESIGRIGEAVYNKGAKDEEKHKEIKIKEDKLRDIGIREGTTSEHYIRETESLKQSQNERDLTGQMMSAMFGYNHKTGTFFERY